jgi:hypothetical protein
MFISVFSVFVLTCVGRGHAMGRSHIELYVHGFKNVFGIGTVFLDDQAFAYRFSYHQIAFASCHWR